MLGRRYYGEEGVLRSLRHFVIARDESDLTARLFEQWCEAQRHLSPNTRHSRQLLVRKFCLFRQRAEPRCFVPDPSGFVRRRPYRRPVILSPAQIRKMLREAARLGPSQHCPLRSSAMRFALVLLWTAGLRRAEVVRLTLADVDHREGILYVRESKFHKSRWVPLSVDAARELRRYLRVRRRHGVPFHVPLLSNHSQGYGLRGWHGYSGESLAAGIRELFERAVVRDSEGRRPQVRDLRHSFAVQAVRRHYLSNKDVQSFLPKLSLYMGHVSIVSTAHYLHFTPDVAQLASARFKQHFSHLVGRERGA
jgi:integrase/recombinase XerD